MNNDRIIELAKIIWDYHHLNHQLQKADCIFVLCSNDIRVAEYASRLFLDGYGSFIIFSGGSGVLTRDIFDKPEAEIFADIAVRSGIPSEKIIIENKSMNTGENVAFTKRILSEKDLDFDRFILVQKPYMERRTYATFKKLWPEKEFVVTSPAIPYEDYPNEIISRDYLINIMVGDLQRIKIYPDRGFQIYQEIPADVWKAYEELVALGYTKHLIKD